jgi:hypothetical protein
MDTQQIYASIMTWLGTGEAPAGSSRSMLKINLDNGAVLAFRRIDMMSEQRAAEYIKDPRVRIFYDPNWDVHRKLEGIVAEAKK